MKRCFNKINKKITQWEYWNTWLIYLPLFPFWLYQSLRNRSFFFFEKANPGIKFGGMAMQSKIDIYQLIDHALVPSTTFVKKDEIAKIDYEKISNYPVVVKPNEGLKGLGVSIIHSEIELREYFKNCELDTLIQEKINQPIELGVFYCRYPNSENGFITGITEKKFMTVLGDGVSTVNQLIASNERLSRQIKAIERNNKEQLQHIPNKSEEYILQAIGSHTRGAEFRNVTFTYLKDAYEKINPIAKKIKGFYFGRFDILCDIDFKTNQIRAFKIIELNGAMSEPIHIYDPNNSLLKAWKEIIKHWQIMGDIALQNKKTPSTDLIEGLKLIHQNLMLEKKLKKQLYG